MVRPLAIKHCCKSSSIGVTFNNATIHHSRHNRPYHHSFRHLSWSALCSRARRHVSVPESSYYYLLHWKEAFPRPGGGGSTRRRNLTTTKLNDELENLEVVLSSMRSSSSSNGEMVDQHDLRMIQHLLEYKVRHGDCHVPTGRSTYARQERQRLAAASSTTSMHGGGSDEDEDGGGSIGGNALKDGGIDYTVDKSVQPTLELQQSLSLLEELADWLEQQRMLYRTPNKRGRRRKGAAEAAAHKFLLLESMGVLWSAREAQWHRSFNRLKSLHKTKTAHIWGGRPYHNSKTKDLQEDVQLRTWADLQRQLFQTGRLDKEREGLLRDIGFIFDLQEAQWWEQYDKLCHYKEEHNGDTVVPVEYECDPSLGSWVARQRHLYAERRLSEARIDALNDIGFSWNPNSEIWERNYAELCQFFEVYGHTRVPRSAGSLFHWVDRQRRLLREHGRRSGAASGKSSTGQRQDVESLSNTNAKKLSKLGLEWEHNDHGTAILLDDEAATTSEEDLRAKRLEEVTLEAAVHDIKWMESFNDLCAFKAKFGHFSIPTNPSEKYTELSNWCRHQRYLFNAQRLPEDRVVLLDKIGFAWTAQAARWEKMYQEFIQFHREYGHSRVPVKKAELYRWTSRQRKTLLNRKALASDDRPTQKSLQKSLLQLQELLLAENG